MRLALLQVALSGIDRALLLGDGLLRGGFLRLRFVEALLVAADERLVDALDLGVEPGDLRAESVSLGGDLISD